MAVGRTYINHHGQQIYVFQKVSNWCCVIRWWVETRADFSSFFVIMKLFQLFHIVSHTSCCLRISKIVWLQLGFPFLISLNVSWEAIITGRNNKTFQQWKLKPLPRKKHWRKSFSPVILFENIFLSVGALLFILKNWWRNFFHQSSFRGNCFDSRCHWK